MLRIFVYINIIFALSQHKNHDFMLCEICTGRYNLNSTRVSSDINIHKIAHVHNIDLSARNICEHLKFFSLYMFKTLCKNNHKSCIYTLKKNPKNLSIQLNYFHLGRGSLFKINQCVTSYAHICDKILFSTLLLIVNRSHYLAHR